MPRSNAKDETQDDGAGDYIYNGNGPWIKDDSGVEYLPGSKVTLTAEEHKHVNFLIKEYGVPIALVPVAQATEDMVANAQTIGAQTVTTEAPAEGEAPAPTA